MALKHFDIVVLTKKIDGYFDLNRLTGPRPPSIFVIP